MDEPLTRDDIFDMAADWLSEAGIRLVVDATPDSHPYAAMQAAVADYGPRVAVIYAPDEVFRSPMYVHWVTGQSDVPEAALDAFTKAGATATWIGTVSEPVVVHLPA